jgi:hypothetical protein
MGLGLAEFKFKHSFHFLSNQVQGKLVWKLQISACNHANLNSQSRRARQIRILRNLSDFFKPVWTPNKFGPNSKAVLIPGILVRILF